jgi:glutathione synthase/RimK-type ligase-like ATP-grasp enzyme
MPEVAFTTYASSPELSDDDRLVAEVLRRRGISVSPIVWDAADVDWVRFDAVIIRSPWDYHLKPKRYEHWLRGHQAVGTRLWNPAAVVLQNMHKRYLLDFAGRGVEIVPTRCFSMAEVGESAAAAMLDDLPWDDVIIKPGISASAHGTWRARRPFGQEVRSRFKEQRRTGDLLIQEYMTEVASHGEYSLVFFDRHYSHGVLKRPKDGDFRVHEALGGRFVAVEPSRAIIEQAERVLSLVEGPLLYARVDGIERDGRFVLMELEINEPELLLRLSAEAPERFAEAIVNIMD